jgi:hypothetical protein
MSELAPPDPIGDDRRRARRRAALPPDPQCALCSLTDPDALKRVPLFELHHVVGVAADADLMVVLCRNCHACQTGLQHDYDALPPTGRTARPDSMLETIARALRSLAVFIHDLAHTLTRYAAMLMALTVRLDADVPDWRDWQLGT